MNKEALLIVDPQLDFMPGGSLAVNDGDQIVEPLNRMINFAIEHDWKIYVSRDWHPENTRHFVVNGGIWPIHCVQETIGARFHPALNLENAVVLSKGMGIDEDAYSSFDALDIKGLDLENLLKRDRVNKIYLGGLATDYCVKATALDAGRLGYRTVLMLDACRAVNLEPTDGQKALAEMIKIGLEISNTEDFFESLVSVKNT